MTADLWVPAVIVLALGFAAGWWLIRRVGSSGNGSASDPPDAASSDASLEVADLGHRRDELYARLRDPGLPEDRRRGLELEAARVLRSLDEAEAAGGKAAGESAGVEVAPPASQPASSAKTLLTGFAFGGGTVALIALLVFWAGRDSTARDPMAGAPSQELPHPVAELPSEVAAEVDELLARIAGTPEDLAARKRLALLYLGTDQYVPAFEQAGAILAVAPDDIDSLYVQGVVRMTMGQDEAAMERLDRVLGLYPDHVRAMTVQGLIFARRGERDRAEAVWERALEIAGPQPQIDSLLAMLDSEVGGELPPGHPRTDAASTAAAAGAASPGSYTVRVDAEIIPGFLQTGVVFVALRSTEGAPPVAVRRIDRPVFPMMVTIGPNDMMMAVADAELPESGLLTVRLDQDGSASTRGDNDLEGSARMKRGDVITIVLQ